MCIYHCILAIELRNCDRRTAVRIILHRGSCELNWRATGATSMQIQMHALWCNYCGVLRVSLVIIKIVTR